MGSWATRAPFCTAQMAMAWPVTKVRVAVSMSPQAASGTDLYREAQSAFRGGDYGVFLFLEMFFFVGLTRRCDLLHQDLADSQALALFDDEAIALVGYVFARFGQAIELLNFREAYIDHTAARHRAVDRSCRPSASEVVTMSARASTSAGETACSGDI